MMRGSGGDEERRHDGGKKKTAMQLMENRARGYLRDHPGSQAADVVENHMSITGNEEKAWRVFLDLVEREEILREPDGKCCLSEAAAGEVFMEEFYEQERRKYGRD